MMYMGLREIHSLNELYSYISVIALDLVKILLMYLKIYKITKNTQLPLSPATTSENISLLEMILEKNAMVSIDPQNQKASEMYKDSLSPTSKFVTTSNSNSVLLKNNNKENK